MEYILTLFVTMAILLGGLYQFRTAFQAFVDSYFGEYLVCLLETGELPSLKSTPGTGECDSSFEPFSLANGRPLIPINGGNDGGVGSDPGGNSDSNNSANNGRAKRITKRTGAGSDGPNQENGGSLGATNGGQVDIAGSGASGMRRRLIRRPGAFGSGKNTKGKKVPIRFPADSVNDPYATSAGGLRQRRFGIPYSEEDGEDEVEGASIAGSVGDNSDFSTQGRRKKIPIGQREPAKIEDKDPDLSFGNMMRYLMIGAMIVAIFLFLGNQLNSISKSM